MNKFYSFFKKATSIITTGVTACMLFCSLSTQAQVDVVPDKTAAELASILVGTGVTVLRPSLTCDSMANGSFKVVSSILGIDSGIVLASGLAATPSPLPPFGSYGVNGPADPSTGSVNASTGFGAPGDADLTTLSGEETHDACILEFDFRPTGDTIKFNYVFGSEEYPGFTCTDYNDVFGFFISGPGYPTATNIALVPGTSIPVAINSVNSGIGEGFDPVTFMDTSTAACRMLGPGSPFTMYFVDNTGGTTITYDGLTKVLQAIANVTPCDTYHLKLGVADANDDIYDSGVFIQAKSLSSTGIHIASLGLGTRTIVGTDTSLYCVRGCKPGAFVFNLPAVSASNLTFIYTIGGTAVNGYDYDLIPDSITIPAGTLSDTLYITPTHVAPAGPKTVNIVIYSPYDCDGRRLIIDSASLLILDSFSMHIVTADTAVCAGASVPLKVVGDSALSYMWAPAATLSNDTISNPVATPLFTTTYVVTGSYLPDAGCLPVHDQVTVSIVTSTSRPATITNTCVGVTTPLNVTEAGGGSYSYSWSPGTYLSSTSSAKPTVTPTDSGNVVYVVTITPTAATCLSYDTLKLHILPNDFALLTPDTTICIGGTVPVRVIGDTEFTYRWTPYVDVSNREIMNPVITPETPGTWTLTATYAGCPPIQHSIDIDIEHPIANIVTSDTSICPLATPLQIITDPQPNDTVFTYTWTPTDGISDPTTQQPFFTETAYGDFTYTLVVATQLGCKDTDQITIHARPPVQLVVSPVDTTIPYGSSVLLTATNLMGTPCYFYWTPDNGSLDNANIHNPVAAPVDSTTYTVVAISQYGCRDSAIAKVGIDYAMNEIVPSAFSPNGDGLNDVFRVINVKYQKVLDFRVFNRWGQLIFHSNDGTTGWDGTYNGTPQDIGTYSYLVVVAKPDGTEKTYRGNVTLLR